MGYTKLIDLKFKHEFFGEGAFPPVRVVPSKETKKKAQNFGLIFKYRNGGYIVAWDDENEAFSTLDTENQKEFKLTFYLQMGDSLFENYSELSRHSQKGLYYYSNIHANEEGDNCLLSKDTFTSPADYCGLAGESFRYERNKPGGETIFEITDIFDEPVESIAVNDADQKYIPVNLSGVPSGYYTLQGQDTAAISFYKDAGLFWKPVFGVIELFLFENKTGVSQILSRQSNTPQTYAIKFKARSTIWRYYIIPKHKPDVKDVVITNGRNGSSINFINKGHQRLSDGSDALVFDSESAIMLKQNAVNMYQLKSGTGQTLVKTLPTPSVNFINAITENDQQHFYSEMYVYL